MQNKTLPITGLGKKIVDYYKSIDCKYFVINVEDLINSLDSGELLWFNDILQRYNDYREENGKGIQKYFCLHREDFPEFKDNALEFLEWLHSIYNYAYGK